jgi:hypothetical protein
MAFPQPILSRLHLGGDIAAEVQATQPEYWAWVYVRPLMKTSFPKARERWTRERQYQPVDFSIKGYYIRYIELSQWHLEWGYDLDYALRERPTIDLQMCVRDEDALEQILSQWCHDFSTLGLPQSYPEPPESY